MDPTSEYVSFAAPASPAPIARWVLTATLRQGAAWAVLAALLAFEPLTYHLAPFHIGASSGYRAAALEVAFVGALAGALFGTAVLAGHEPLFRTSSGVGRAWAEGVGLLTVQALFSFTALVVPLLAGRLSEEPGLSTACGGLLWLHLHLAGIGLLTLRIRAATSVRCAFLVSFAWVLPILSLSSEGEPGFLAILLGASLHVQRTAGWLEWSAMASVTSLWGLAILLSQPQTAHR